VLVVEDERLLQMLAVEAVKGCPVILAAPRR
jgi:hypothetical protein